MKSAVIALLAVSVAGCSREGLSRVPTAPAARVAAPAPPAPTAGSALLWVMVIRDSGSCIEGATIQIVRTEGAGEPIAQKTPCGAWDDDGGVLLTNLAPDARLTLRGAAAGYAPRDESFLPSSTHGSYRAVFITLSKEP